MNTQNSNRNLIAIDLGELRTLTEQRLPQYGNRFLGAKQFHSNRFFNESYSTNLRNKNSHKQNQPLSTSPTLVYKNFQTKARIQTPKVIAPSSE